jgi:hypothetical protein
MPWTPPAIHLQPEGELNPTRESVTDTVLHAILDGSDKTLTRAQWRTAVMFLHNRNRDQAIALNGLQDMVKTNEKAVRHERLL